ncbi:hypothetical protein TVAG_122250 [Trichomonas vaginalis G3]|uniref:DnaK protein n=1 Tax=Trichomonas vaginalis (strain ATCC PRA-98 / G3) TaxID=412133 RepID=A2DMY2_TRIV3|nr:ATP binding [Trichomonas vaginalis G3]EAY18159.1 hypothetical protein TVAG_122250 [Trichomonas vaginalis G3]KAI5491456.1 ATP binding [Trichomonas vaginalis G3]|eukprot:XP_001579145.1 hypothetical protein [Trichomonas vaginalis G3]
MNKILPTSIIIGVDVQMDCFRVAIPNTADLIMLLDSNEMPKAFSTTFEVIPKNGTVPDVIDEKNFEKFNYRFLTNHDEIYNPEYTIVHPANFIGKLSTHDFHQLNFKRKYYHQHVSSNNSFYKTVGFDPTVVTTTILHRIKQKIADGGMEVMQAVFSVPKFWVQSQREAIYYPAKQLKLNPRLIDSTTAMGSFITHKYEKKVTKHERRILIIDIEQTSCEAIVFEFSRKNKIFAHEQMYSYTDKAGLRDFECVIADLIQKQTKTPSEPYWEYIRLKEAEKVIKQLNTNTEASGHILGIPYKVTRQQLQVSSVEYLQNIFDMVASILKIVPNIEIDHVEVIGCGARLYTVRKTICQVFGKNRVTVDSEPEQAISVGLANLAFQKINIDTEVLYPLNFVQGKQIAPINQSIPFKTGLVSVEIPHNLNIPVGAPYIVMSANVTENTKISCNPSRIYKFKDSLTPNKRPWVIETMIFTQFVANSIQVNEKMHQLRRYLGFMIGNFSTDLEVSEALNTVISPEDKELLVREVSDLKAYYDKINAKASMEELFKMEEKVKNTMMMANMKKDNLLYLDTSIEKFVTKCNKITEDIKNMVEIFQTSMTDETVQDLLRPLVEAQIWFDFHYRRQRSIPSEFMPQLWWFEVERKITGIEAQYKAKFRKMTDEFKDKKIKK